MHYSLKNILVSIEKMCSKLFAFNLREFFEIRKKEDENVH